MKLVILLVAVCSVSAYPFHEDYSPEMRPWIKAKVKELMKRDMSADVQTHTYTPDWQMHIDVMRELIQEEMTSDTVKVVVKFVSRQHEDFLYAGYLKIYEMIEEKSLGDYALFHLAYQVLRDQYKGQVGPLLSMFPVAVWTVVASGIACIRNRGYGEYLYAGETDLKHDAERRNVFTWMPYNPAGKQGDWVFRHLEGNQFRVENARFGDRLYAGGDAFKWDAERRRVFTWMPHGRNAELQGDVWELELEGEDVFIKNVFYNEYIYAVDGSYYDAKRRRVFSWVPKGRSACDSDTYQCRWMVAVC